MADRTESSIVVDAAPADVMAVIADFDAYPEWTGAVRRPRCSRRTRTAGPAPVRFVLDAGALRDTYTLAYTWDVAGTAPAPSPGPWSRQDPQGDGRRLPARRRAAPAPRSPTG